MCRRWQVRKPCRWEGWQGGQAAGTSAAGGFRCRSVECHAVEIARPAAIDRRVGHGREGVEGDVAFEEPLAGERLEAVGMGIEENQLPDGGEGGRGRRRRRATHAP